MFNGVYKSAWLNNLSSFGRNYFTGTYRAIAHPIVIALFFIISGIVSQFSKNGIKRILKYGAVMLGIFIVTKVYSFITKTQATITIGIMFVFTVSAIISFFLCKIKNKKITLTICVVFSCVFITLGLLNDLNVLALGNDYTFIFFTASKGFKLSADYFPLFPQIGFFLFGFAIGLIFYKDKKPYLHYSPLFKKSTAIFSFIGKTSLWWYIISQIVFIGFFGLLIAFGC